MYALESHVLFELLCRLVPAFLNVTIFVIFLATLDNLRAAFFLLRLCDVNPATNLNSCSWYWSTGSGTWSR